MRSAGACLRLSAVDASGASPSIPAHNRTDANWGNSSFAGEKITGLDSFYGKIGGSKYIVDLPRGHARYCAWHSWGSINGAPVHFAFFFNLDGDPGCDPRDTSGSHTEGLAALANVSGHELSEALTDPRGDAWYDSRGEENADKCAWTFHGLESFGARAG